jgi:hypothetical protein
MSLKLLVVIDGYGDSGGISVVQLRSGHGSIIRFCKRMSNGSLKELKDRSVQYAVIVRRTFWMAFPLKTKDAQAQILVRNQKLVAPLCGTSNVMVPHPIMCPAA